MLEDHDQKKQISINIKKYTDHSLGPDIFTGWAQKSLIKLKQFPLIFANQKNDRISKTLTSFGSQLPYKVVYMGLRPASNMKAFKVFAQNHQNQNVEESFLYSKNILKKFKFHHFQQPEKFFPIRPSEYRLFNGINPTAKNQDIKFSSEFQGGNLDLAINVGPSEYDLMMRVDSNTKGHTNWFFFKVYNVKKKKNIRFNIINFCKTNQLYVEGMKPYVFRTSKMKWVQQGDNVEFKNRSIRYFSNTEQPIISKCLSFTIDFNNLEEQVYFAYSIPYSYSYLLDMLSEMQKKHSQFIRINYNEESTGGLILPIATITNFTNNSDKKHCLVIGRLHPGQPQGSWMVDGFIRYLCSPEAYFIREKVQFRIIPMVNVDGVVLGNFRTGIGGRDLNRIFHQALNFNQIKTIKNQAKRFKPEIFLDFHGHSAKRNVFIYGPEYKIQHKQYLLSRLFPKIISKKTDMFRYYSCLFRISQSKKNTGRSILFTEYQTRYVYTIEASTHGFGGWKEIVHFNAQKYVEVGLKIAESLQDFVKLLLKKPKRIQNHSQEKEQKQKNKRKQKSHVNIVTDSNLLSKVQELQSQQLFQAIEQLQKSLLKQIIEGEKQITIKQTKSKKSQQSDSDYENDKNDYTEKQLRQFQKNPTFNKITQKKTKDKNKNKNNKSLLNKLQKVQPLKKFRTLDSSLTSSANKSLILPNYDIKQSYLDKNLFNPVSSQSLNEQENILKRDIKIHFNRKYKSQPKNDELQKLKKLIELKNIELNKIQNSQEMKLNRNKSANQVFLQVPLQSSMQMMNKRLPKIKSQLNKKQPMLLIRKSFLPSSLMQSNNRILDSLDRNEIGKKQKSLVDQILQMNEKKKKRQLFNDKKKKIKILYFQQ